MTFYRKTMSEITQLAPLRDVKVASFFSGGGGSSLGYKTAGCSVLYANEFVQAARDTYQKNFPTTFIDSRDIREVRADEITKHFGVAEIDILDGSPPCAAFSTAKSQDRSKSWGKEKKYSDTSQQVDDLFFEYIRLVSTLNPKSFVAENVASLGTGVAKGYFNMILQEFRKLDYEVKCFKLNAAMYGVPQRRERIFFIGVRKDLGIIPSAPRPLSKLSTLDQFDGINFDKFCAGGAPNNWKNSKGRPYPTVTTRIRDLKLSAWASCNGWVRDSDNLGVRRITLEELMVICGYPQDFVLTGSLKEKYERLARSVPPPMMAAIANNLVEQLYGNTGQLDL